MRTCDICGKSSSWLDQLSTCYATRHIKEVCKECREELNKPVDKISKMITDLNKVKQTAVRRKMINMKKWFKNNKR